MIAFRNLAASLALASAAVAQTLAIEAAVSAAERAGVRTGVAVCDLDDGETWWRHRAEVEFIPASNQKLLTIGGFLHAFGPGFQFRTGFEVRGGELHVFAGGDPNWITGTDYAPERMFGEVADWLARAGITELRGVELEQGVFGGPMRPDGWPLDQRERTYCAPTGGLLVEAGCFHATVAATDGSEAAVSVVAPPGGFPLSGAIRMTADKQRGSVWGLRQSGGEVRAFGHFWSRGGATTMRAAVEDPAEAYLQTARHVLAERGIRFASAAAARELARFEICTPASASFAAVLADSSNVHAEQLLRVLGAERRTEGRAADGSIAGGCAALRDELAGLVGRLPARLRCVDGSGLSRGNLVSPEFLVRLLEAMLRHESTAGFLDHLAQSGASGTLRGRLDDAALAGRVRAKTGTIRGVSALSGIVQDRGDRLQLFSILMNVEPGRRVSARQMRGWQDDIVAAVFGCGAAKR